MKLGKQNPHHSPIIHGARTARASWSLGARCGKNGGPRFSWTFKLAASRISRIPTWNPQLQNKQKNTIVHPENLVNFKIIWNIFLLHISHDSYPKLVVFQPIWKIWVEFGSPFPLGLEWNIENVCNHQPSHTFHPPQKMPRFPPPLLPVSSPSVVPVGHGACALQVPRRIQAAAGHDVTWRGEGMDGVFLF